MSQIEPNLQKACKANAPIDVTIYYSIIIVILFDY